MTKKPAKKTTQSIKKDDSEDTSLTYLGISFLIIGAALFFTDSASAAGIVFVLVGIVFVVSSGWKLQKAKSSKK